MIFCAKLKHAEPRIGLSVSLTMTVFDLSSKRHAGLFEFEVDVIIRELGSCASVRRRTLFYRLFRIAMRDMLYGAGF